MGMMDGGYNFQDLCHVCGKSQQRGMMKQVHKQDRNKKICEDCYNKLDNKEDYIHISQLKKNLF